jgi:hypothetical protein
MGEGVAERAMAVCYEHSRYRDSGGAASESWNRFPPSYAELMPRAGWMMVSLAWLLMKRKDYYHGARLWKRSCAITK